jgi:chaperonin GroEL
MSREYDDNQSLQHKIMRGADILADNVASTLGPRGRNVLLQERGREPFVTKDGVTVAHFVALEDPIENAAVQVIKQAAVQTNSDAGDGTTTATVLARAILRESQRFIASGVSPTELQRGILLATEEVVENLRGLSHPIGSIDDIRHIATISANNDVAIGNLIATAVDKVGQDGSITIEESRSLETSVDITEGFRFQAGYAATAFINDERRAVMSHEEPLLLVTDHKISAVEPIMPILEMAAREGRPLIFVAEEIEGQALAAMIMNAVRGTLKIAAIKAPYYGEERRDLLEDLALSTGATFFTRDNGRKLSDIKMHELGSAKSIDCSKYFTTIVGGESDYDLVETKIESLKNQIEETESMDECERLQGRVVRLSSGVAVIRVGGSTEVEMTERKHRIEDALEAVRSALDEGVVPGGGASLLRASTSLVITTHSSDQALGASVVQAACREPIRQMAKNSGDTSADIIISKILEQNEELDYGWDFKNQQLTRLIEAGIIDPVKVTRTALQNAASCASTLITTNHGIIQTGE